MRILITGANGYIGKSLYNALKDIHNVTAITRQEVDLTNSLQVEKFFQYKYFDVVLHCAISGGSRLKEDTWEVLENNLQMYYNLLSLKGVRFNKFINFGSGAELFSFMNNEPYGMSKKIIRESVLIHSNFYNIRLFGVFDENEKDSRFIKSNILRYINKKPIIVHENKLMDFFYMKDLIKVVNYYIDNNYYLSKEINCCYENVLSLKNIANIINNLDDYKVDIIIEKQNRTGYKSDTPLGLDIELIGLEQGIKNVYGKLKLQKLLDTSKHANEY